MTRLRKWHTDYSKDGNGYRAQCPYCGAVGLYVSLSEAVTDALIHAEVCGDDDA